MTACGTERLVHIYAAAEITVLSITMPFVSVDLLKQSSVTNRTPERSQEPSATLWHLGQESMLMSPLDTCRMDRGPRCSATVYRVGREGLPGFPPLLLPAPFCPTEAEFPVAAGPQPLPVWSCQGAPLSSTDPTDPDVASRETDVLQHALLAKGNE